MGYRRVVAGLADAEATVVRRRRPVPIYSIVKDLGRGERLMGDEPRAQESSLNSSIPDGKKRIGGLRSVLMGIQPVTDKGFISFAARKCRRTGKRLEAAKVMKPRSELNRETEAGL